MLVGNRKNQLLGYAAGGRDAGFGGCRFWRMPEWQGRFPPPVLGLTPSPSSTRGPRVPEALAVRRRGIAAARRAGGMRRLVEGGTGQM